MNTIGAKPLALWNLCNPSQTPPPAPPIHTAYIIIEIVMCVCVIAS